MDHPGDDGPGTLNGRPLPEKAKAKLHEDQGGKAENGANIGILMLAARFPRFPAP